jgi:hypothetical protein
MTIQWKDFFDSTIFGHFLNFIKTLVLKELTL